MIWNVLTVLFFALAPAGVITLCRKVKWLGKVGPVLILYLIGIIFGNVFHPSALAGIQDTMSSAMVPLAIPLMLFACTFSRSQTRSQLLALLTGILAVSGAVVIGFFIFGRDIPDGAKIGGMMTGVYTGGTINLAALKVMLGVPEETFILLNSYDMVVSFVYLTFLLSIGIRLMRRILPNTSGPAADGVCGQSKPGAAGRVCGKSTSDDRSLTKEDEAALKQAVDAAAANPYAGLFTRAGLKDAGVLLGLDVLIIGISAGLGMLAPEGWFMTVLILMLTTLGIAASFIPKVRIRKYGYEIGMYFIYIFSIVVASMADLSKFDLGSGLGMLSYLSFVIFGSLLLQVLMAKILRIDADTLTISSVTYICSPPFVPMMAAAMKNRSVLAIGLAIGVVGYAAGNYLGFLLATLLGG